MTATQESPADAATKVRVIDADGHVMESFSTWPQYLPAHIRDEVVALQTSVIMPGGTGADDALAAIDDAGPEAVAANPGADPEGQTRMFIEGGWDPTARLADMDAEGMDVAVLYPTLLLGVLPDAGLFAQSCRAYNDWLRDYCATDPARLVGVAVIPFQDVEASVAEARRAVEQLGFRAIMIRPVAYLDGTMLYDPMYDPLWRTAVELGVGIGVHPFPFPDLPDICRAMNLARGMRFPQDNITLRQGLSNALDVMMALGYFVAGGICERFPDLQVAFLEGSGGWLPSMLERLEHHFHIFGSELQRTSPTELFKRQCYISFDPDEYGLPHTAAFIGADRILWASDYPHPDAKIPGTVAELREAIRPMATSDQALVLGANAARFYGL